VRNGKKNTYVRRQIKAFGTPKTIVLFALSGSGRANGLFAF
jgi:hypothetical protein